MRISGHHLIKLTDFWETNLFGVHNLKGVLLKKHLKVDKNLDYGIDHFILVNGCNYGWKLSMNCLLATVRIKPSTWHVKWRQVSI